VLLLPPAVTGPAARCRLPLARPSSAKLHLPRGLRQSWWAARNLVCVCVGGGVGGITEGRGFETEGAEGMARNLRHQQQPGEACSSLTKTQCGSSTPSSLMPSPEDVGLAQHRQPVTSPSSLPLQTPLLPPLHPLCNHLRMSDWLSTASLSPPAPSGSATTILWLAAGWRLWPPDQPDA
jgi:hypothetical protein